MSFPKQMDPVLMFFSSPDNPLFVELKTTPLPVYDIIKHIGLPRTYKPLYPYTSIKKKGWPRFRSRLYYVLLLIFNITTSFSPSWGPRRSSLPSSPGPRRRNVRECLHHHYLLLVPITRLVHLRPLHPSPDNLRNSRSLVLFVIKENDEWVRMWRSMGRSLGSVLVVTEVWG